MKPLIFISLFSTLFAFEVHYKENYPVNITFTHDAVFLNTDQSLEVKLPYFKLSNGYLIYADHDTLDEYLRNSLYLPKNTKVEYKKIALIKRNYIRAKLIETIKKSYKQCKIDNITFLNSLKPYYLKEQSINLEINITLECK